MTAPTTIRFNISAAQDALARADDGLAPLPGDAALIARYEGYCQQEYGRFLDECYERDRLAWLATQCRHCEPGGTGDDCDDHYEEAA